VNDATWRSRLRWFAAEFFVVVSGILVALALQAGYQTRQDHRAERMYLIQLKSDLARNDSVFSDAIQADSASIAASRHLVAALYNLASLPRDSAYAWFDGRLDRYSDPRPVMGTVTSLISTGDIRLFSDAALRSGITEFAGSMDSDLQALSRNVDRLIRAVDAGRLQHARDGFPYLGRSAADSASNAGKIAAKWPTLRADSDLRAAIGLRQIAFNNRMFYMSNIRDQTRILQKLVDTAMKD
jgi:hypothetical protein